jgi:polyisoprenoid-binding protein YceI
MTSTFLRLVFAAVLLMGGASFAAAKTYTVDPAASTVKFSGTHAGNLFEGVFETWTAEIVFDPANLPGSFIKTKFDTASAKIGNAMYDGTLPQADWFDASNHPHAVFESTSITTAENGAYKAMGTLTLRGITQPVEFVFTLSDLAVQPVKASASFDIDRLAFDIGKGSDAKAEWVDQRIKIMIDLSASSSS